MLKDGEKWDKHLFLHENVFSKSEAKSEAWVWVETKSEGCRVRAPGFTYWLYGSGLPFTIKLSVPQFFLQWKAILPSNSWVCTED